MSKEKQELAVQQENEFGAMSVIARRGEMSKEDKVEVAEFQREMQASLGVSPLAFGTQFLMDDLVDAENVLLYDVDIASYKDGEGRDVRFAVWRVAMQTDVDVDKGEWRDGFIQSGVVLTKLADAILDDPEKQELLHKFGLPVSLKWDTTKSKNKIITVTIL